MKTDKLRELERAERAVAGLHGPQIPGALIQYGDGTSKRVVGFAEACEAALAGGVESITGDDADFTALLRALTGKTQND